MKKVLHLRCSGQLLGAERVVLEMAKYLPEFGYQPVLGIPVEAGQGVPEYASTAEKLGFEVVIFPIESAFDRRAIADIRQYVKEHQVDIIHTHGYREDFYAVFARAGAALVATNHLWKRTTPKLKLYALLDALLLRCFDAIIAVSHRVQGDMTERGISAKKITVVPNGIDPDNFTEKKNQQAIRSELSIPSGALVLGTLSSLTVEKGINIAIEALVKIRAVNCAAHLLIVGEGPEHDSLKALVHSRGLDDAVSFAGRRSDTLTMFAAMDIYLLPSFSEGLPMSLLEAMASGKAVIATAVGEVESVLEDGSGIVIEPDNIDQLTEAVLSLADPAEIVRHGQLARSRVRQKFSAQKMAHANACIYDNVLAKEDIIQ